MKIIEVSQFVDTTELKKSSFNDVVGWIEDENSGINNDWLRQHGIREVSDDATPICGYVWLKESANGLCEVYAYNYDSSD